MARGLIEKLKNLCIETVLVERGRARCKVVVPSGKVWRVLGKRVQDRIAQKSILRLSSEINLHEALRRRVRP